MMLKPILKSEGVNESERQLSKLLNDTFLSLWSYIGPYSDEGAAKNKQGKEICDALVIFGNKIIIFSDKEIKFNEEKEINVAWPRWYKKSVSDSARQLHGAEDWIMRYPERIFLDKFCKEPFPLDLLKGKFEIHLIAITKNSSEPAKKYFGQYGTGSSGTFAQLYDLSQEQIKQTPFTISDIDQSKTFVHIFDEYSIDLVVNETGTIVDFLHYLNVKEKLVRQYNLGGAMGEENLLAFYLAQDPSLLARNKFNFDEFKQYKESMDSALCISEDEWDIYQNSLNYKLRKILLDKSKYWGELLTRFSDAIITAQVGEGAELELASHEIAVRTLASENLVFRAILSDSFNEKFFNVPSNIRSARIVKTIPKKDLLYIFLLLPHNETESLEEYVIKRNTYSQGYGLVAKYLNPEYTKIIVIATQPQNSLRRSEAVYLFDYPKILTYQNKKTAEKLRKEQDILREFTNYNHSLKNHESQLKVKKGRNEICHCGTKLKYKKCCLRRDELSNSRYT